MFCPTCGAPNEDNAWKCTRCSTTLPHAGPVIEGAPAQVDIPNYLVQSILVTLCCCVPAGIVAIVYSAQVNGKVQAGDLEGARRCSRIAFWWAWTAFGLGGLVGAFYAFATLLGTLGSR